MTGGDRRRRRGVMLAGASAGLLVGCGGDGGGDVAGPLVADIRPAVAAVEAELGAPQDYFEIYADRLAVTLWVADENGRRVVPYVYAGGELSDAQAGQEASGPTFDADAGLAFDPDEVLDEVTEEFGDRVADFSVGVEGDEVTFAVTVQSDAGGRLRVRVGGEGQVLEAAPMG